MEMERETGGTQPPAQGHLEPQELEEAGKTLPAACGGSRAPGHLDLRHLVSRTGGTLNFCVFKSGEHLVPNTPGNPDTFRDHRNHLWNSIFPSRQVGPGLFPPTGEEGIAVPDQHFAAPKVAGEAGQAS